jgi:hypothetical protein
MLRQPISYLVLFLSLLFTYHFFSLFCFCALFSSIIALGSYCIFFVSRAGYLRLQASLFFHFYSVLRDCSFYRLIMEAHHLHFTLFEY